MSLFSNAVRVLVASGLALPLGIASSVLLARFLSVPDRGHFALLTSFATIGSFVLHLGLPSASIYRIRRHAAPPGRVLSSGLAAYAIALSPALLLVAALREPLSARWLEDPPAAAFLLALASVPCLVVGEFLRGIAQGSDRFDLDNGYAVLASGGLLLALVGALVLTPGALTAAISAYLLVQFGATAWLGLRVAALARPLERPEGSEVRAAMRFGLQAWLQNVLIQLHDTLDRFLLAFLVGDAAEVAFYAVAVGVTSRLAIVPSAILTATYPALAGASQAEAGRLAALVMRHSLYWMLVTALALAAVAWLLVPVVYGEAYRASVEPLLWLLPGVVAQSIGRGAARYFVALDRHGVPIAARVLTLLANLLLNLWLIPRHGAVGAALANLGSCALEAVLIGGAFCWHAAQTPAALLLPRRGDLAPYLRRLRALRAATPGT